MGVLAEATRLLGAVRGLREQRTLRERIAAQEAFARISNDWKTIKQSQRKNTPRHNLIRFLGFERKEVAFHSPFLCDLLNPNGAHHQGTVFLQNFLQMLSARARSSGVNWDYQWRDVDAPEAAQWLVLAERKRIDISIRNHSEGVLIFVEIKIGALEQDRQLCRYRIRLDAEAGIFKHRLLVFLAPKGYGPPQTGKPDIVLRYEQDIASWIETIEAQIPDTAVSLRGNLRQYYQVVQELNEDRIMPNQDLVDLIVQPLNFPWTLEIEAAMWDAKSHLLRRFWRAVAQALEAKLAKSGLGNVFRTDGLSRFERDPRANYDGVFLVENGVLPDRAHVTLGVFHEDKRIFPGVAFSHQQPNPSPLSEVRALCQALPEHWRNPNDWWVGCDDPGYRSDFRRVPAEARSGRQCGCRVNHQRAG